MKIGIIGYGQMGKTIERVAIARGHSISVIVDPKQGYVLDELSPSVLEDTDVYIDFSVPEAVVENVKMISAHGKSMVVGTTGWYEKLGEIEEITLNRGIALVYSQNFSMGMNIFFDIVQFASRVINHFPEYDVAGFEIHHNRKKDIPSGTAKKISEIVLRNVDRKKKATFFPGNRKIDSEELHFSSVRCGDVVGEHTLILDSSSDTIRLSHSAKNRDGFALGALVAAENIQNLSGVHTFDEILKIVLKEAL